MSEDLERSPAPPEPERCSCGRPANYTRVQAAGWSGRVIRTPWCGDCIPEDDGPRSPIEILRARVFGYSVESSAGQAVTRAVQAAAERRAWEREHLAIWQAALACARFERLADASGRHGPMPTLAMMGADDPSEYGRRVSFMRARFADQPGLLDHRLAEWTWGAEGASIDQELEQMLEGGTA